MLSQCFLYGTTNRHGYSVFSVEAMPQQSSLFSFTGLLFCQRLSFLRNSVHEEHCRFREYDSILIDFTPVCTVRPYRHDGPADVGFSVCAAVTLSVIFQADVDRHCVIDLICPLAVFVLIHNDICRDPLTEVIHHKPRPDFLQNGAAFPCMEVRNTDGIFQLTERCLDASSQMVQIFENRRRELISRQRCDDRFPCTRIVLV